MVDRKMKMWLTLSSHLSSERKYWKELSTKEVSFGSWYQSCKNEDWRQRNFPIEILILSLKYLKVFKEAWPTDKTVQKQAYNCEARTLEWDESCVMDIVFFCLFVWIYNFFMNKVSDHFWLCKNCVFITKTYFMSKYQYQQNYL